MWRVPLCLVRIRAKVMFGVDFLNGWYCQHVCNLPRSILVGAVMIQWTTTLNEHVHDCSTLLKWIQKYMYVSFLFLYRLFNAIYCTRLHTCTYLYWLIIFMFHFDTDVKEELLRLALITVNEPACIVQAANWWSFAFTHNPIFISSIQSQKDINSHTLLQS